MRIATAAPPPPPGGDPRLTPPEKEIARLLRLGLTERAAAARLGRSPNTVHVYVRAIYMKLGVRSRREFLDYPGLADLIEADS
ncbi:MAG: helix-turn-helix transcriptional regulator [Planctomycetota bacterium]